MSKMANERSELALISWLRGQEQRHEQVLMGIGDDMAILNWGGAAGEGSDKLLITTDLLLDGVHFELESAGAEAVGYKAMACSLSDCAAMGALPVAAVAAVSLPRGMTMEEAQGLHRGMQDAGTRYNCPLVGGDTTSWDGKLTVGITMLGRSGGIEPVLRSGARAGDVIVVTGRLGGSLEGRHLCFEPRIAEGRYLAEHGVRAMMDISDGLGTDLRHICRASKTAAVLKREWIPISEAAKRSKEPMRGAFCDGEDFELLGCMAAADYEKVQKEWGTHFEVGLTAIGTMAGYDEVPEAGQELWFECAGGLEAIVWSGWEHFHG